MPIPVVCQSCGAKLKAPDSAAGRKAKCSKCGAPLDVPAASPTELGHSAPALGQADAVWPQQTEGHDSDEDRRWPAAPPLPPPQLEEERDPASLSTFRAHDRTGTSDSAIERGRPLGLVLIALYSAISALGSHAAFYIMAIVAALTSVASKELGPVEKGLVASQTLRPGQAGLFAMAFLALAVFQCAVCYGLLTLQRWSYVLTPIVYGASLAIYLLAILAIPSEPIKIELIWLVGQIAVTGAVIVYFVQPLRAYFRR